MVKIALVDDAFSGLFELEASPVEGQSLQQKDKKRKKRKGKKEIKKPKSLKTLSSEGTSKHTDFQNFLRPAPPALSPHKAATIIAEKCSA